MPPYLRVTTCPKLAFSDQSEKKSVILHLSGFFFPVVKMEVMTSDILHVSAERPTVTEADFF